MIAIYGILSAIDYILYSLAGAMFRVIVDLATVEFFEESIITNIANRVYIIVGVLMLFKLVISAVQYMINPDMFDDKEKGLSGILTRAVISLGLIVIVPIIFSLALKVQEPIVKAIPNIVFGTENRVGFDNDERGNNISFQVLSVFIPVREGHENKISTTEKITDLRSFQHNIMAGCPPVSLFGLFGSYDDCHYNYMVVISTAAGVFLCFVLFVMISDIAIRTIKLGIIRILAPIPISSYMFSKDKLNQFVKTAITVYLDLFIRMFVLYFVVFTIENVFSSGLIRKVAGGDVLRNIIVTVAIVVGLFMFAKNAPKFITDILGLKDVSSDDMKNMFTRAGGMFGATVGAGKSFIAGRANARNEAISNIPANELEGLTGKARRDRIKKGIKEYNKKQGRGHGIYGRAFRSAGAAYRTGAYQAYFKGKGYNDAYSASDKSGQRSYELEKSLQDNDISRMDYYKEVAKRRMGINSDLDVMNKEIEAAKNASDKSKAALDYAHNYISEKFGGVKFTDEMMKDDDFIKRLQVVANKSIYSFGEGKVNVDLTSMGKSGPHTIAGVMNDLKTVIENKTGTFSGDDVAIASRMLDKLQGESDKYIINMTKKIQEAIKTDPSIASDPAKWSQYGSLGFDKNANPAFVRLIQEALEANIVHSGDTQYGRDVWIEAEKKGYLQPKYDADGNIVKENGKIVYAGIKPEYIGDWLSLNKKMGQEIQTANIAAKGTQGASATLKSITDKFDKK